MFTYDAGAGITLRLLEQRDAALLQQTILANFAHFDRWFHWHRRHEDPQAARDWIRQNLERHARGGGHDAGIFIAADDDDRWNGLVDLNGLTLAGMCGIHEIDTLDRVAAFGYWLAKKHCGRGLTTRCVAHQLDHFFNTGQIDRAEILCADKNTASRAIPERLGFTQDGVLRQRMLRGGVRYDEVHYGLLASEWLALGGAQTALKRVAAKH